MKRQEEMERNRKKTKKHDLSLAVAAGGKQKYQASHQGEQKQDSSLVDKVGGYFAGLWVYALQRITHDLRTVGEMLWQFFKKFNFLAPSAR